MEKIVLPTFDDMINIKTLTKDQREIEIQSLKKFDGLSSSIKLAGNKYIQHYFFKEIGKVKFDNKPSLFEIMNNKEAKIKLYKGTITKDKNLAVNMSQAYTRISPVCIFKPTIAKFLYTKFAPTSILDPTAGWGGRMLGAVSYGVKYTGIDTNISLRPIYKEMMEELKGNTHMIWDDCLKVDFSTINYDMVLTSPPYINKELYEHMKPFENNKSYYIKFLIPLINKCLANINNNGFVCININKEYYECLLSYGYRKANEIVEYQQSTRKKAGVSKMEYVYCWRNIINDKEIKEEMKECNDNKCSKCLSLEEENKILRKKIEQLKLLI